MWRGDWPSLKPPGPLVAFGNPADSVVHTQSRGFASPGHPGFAFIDAGARSAGPGR